MSLLARILRHHRALLFTVAVLCVAGLVQLRSFPVAILPDVTFPRIVIIAEGGDRPPAMMEATVTRCLEPALAPVPGVRRLRSKTMRGAAELAVDFDWGTDMAAALMQVNARLGDARRQLPAEVSLTAERMNPTLFPILGLGLTSTRVSQAELLRFATYELRPRLAAVPGVARVVVQGGQVPELLVEVHPEALEALHLTAADVESTLAQANVVRGVGRLVRSYQQEQVLVSGQLHQPRDLERLVVASRGPTLITLGMVASVRPAVQDRATVVQASRGPAVLVNIVRQPAASTPAVAAAVQEVLRTVQLPRGAQLETFYDQAVIVGEAVRSVRDAVLVGSVLAVVVLFGFLRNLRVTLVTAAIIPATLALTFLAMRLTGQSLNLMTLGALAVGVGLVVDDAIVVVENVVRHLARSGPQVTSDARTAAAVMLDAVREATAEIASPLLSSTLTTVVVFLPLTWLSGITGAFFAPLAVTLSLAVLVSLVLALTVSPALCLGFARPPASEAEGEPEGFLERHVLPRYESLLLSSLVRRPLLPTVVLGVLLVTGLLASSLSLGFMPEMDEGAFVLDYLTPSGTSLAESDRLLSKVDAILRDTPEVATFSRRTGTELGFAVTEPHRGDYAVTLKEGRERGIEEVIADVRRRIASQVAGFDADFSQVLQDLIGDLAGATTPVEIKLFGGEQLALQRAATGLATALKQQPGAVDVKSGVVESGPELVLEVDPVAAGRVGLSADAVASQAQLALAGDVPTQLLQGDRALDVRVRYPWSWRSEAARVESLPERTPAGATLPLASLGTLRRVPGTCELTRENQRRFVAVTSRLAPGHDLGSMMARVEALLARTPLPVGVRYELGGQHRLQREAFANLLAVLLAAIVLVFTVMVFGLGGFRLPALVVGLLPLSLVGVVAALAATGTPLNVSSFMGAIMLVGLVVKNGILLFDQARHAEAVEGCSPEEAVLRAGRSRLRPILMTTLTALLGLVPLALGLGAGAQMQQPLAIAVIGGLSCSTLFTLWLAPLLYVATSRRPVA